MRILALETSVTSGSVAVLDAERLLGETSLAPGQRTAQYLVPLLLSQLRKAGWRPRDVQLYAVTRGPGSFTGTRVGVTTAKTLAYAVGAGVMGVDTLEAIAVQAFCDDRAFPHDPSLCEKQTVCAVLDAQRRQLFSARFRRLPDGAVEAVEPGRLVDTDRWLGKLQPGDVVAGPGLRRVLDNLTAGVAIADKRLWIPRAETVARIALRSHRNGRRDDVWQLAPCYYRPSAAEEKHAQRNR